jgi:hypothetical protein
VLLLTAKVKSCQAGGGANSNVLKKESRSDHIRHCFFFNALETSGFNRGIRRQLQSDPHPFPVLNKFRTSPQARDICRPLPVAELSDFCQGKSGALVTASE